MSQFARIFFRLGLLAALWLPLAATGCDDGGGSTAADAGTDTDTDTDVDTDADSDAGADAGPDAGAFCDRGDPADFPTDCLATCAEACARLDECGGASAPGCSMTLEECTAACGIAIEGGMSWDDVSGHFRCCTAQEECADVAGCGGWLAHPDAVEPCGQYCDCWDSLHDWGALGSTHAPPPGYDWAPSVVAIAPSDETADYEARYGTAVMARGGLVFLQTAAAGPVREMIADRLRQDETPLPTFVDGAGRVAAADGDIVIVATEPMAILAARALVAARGFASVRDLGWSQGKLHLAEGGDPWVAVDAMWALNAIPGVHAELDMVRIYEKRMTPDDPMFPDEWHVLNQGQDDPELTGGAQLAIDGADGRVSEAWDLTVGDPATVIAIFDDGVSLTHPDLTANLLAPYNHPDDWDAQLEASFTASGGSDYYYLSGHGTGCASVAAASGDNGIGMSGVCPGCSIQPTLFWDPASGSDGLPTSGGFMAGDEAVAAIYVGLVDLGASIISNSWGLGGEDPQFEGSVGSYPDLATVTNDAFNYAEANGRGGLGTLIVFAAGNSNMDIADDPYTGHANVVGVAAVDDQGLKSYYSSYGSNVDVAAPSSGGLNGITAIYSSPTSATDPEYRYNFGGTSSATPYVSGVLGLMLSANPALTAAEARQILTDSATEIDPVWGEWSGGFSPFYGSGLVNAYRAVQMATGACTDAATCFAPSDVCAAGCDGTACAVCRTDNDCADGWVCQPLPALGETVCVEVVASDTCGADFDYVNGHCLPTRTACGLCGDTELCNGRDDDCDGQVDEELADCGEAGRCLQNGSGCAVGQACAATICVDNMCVDATTCGTGEECTHVKTRYGDIEAAIGVCTSAPTPSSCYDRCLVRDSSGLDEEMQTFAECTPELVDNCTDATSQECRDLLPDGT